MTRVYKLSAALVVALAAASAFIEPGKLPLGIVMGGVLAALNYRGMARGLRGVLGAEHPTLKIVVLSIIRLSVLFAVIITLAVMRLVDMIGLLVGFTAVVVVVVLEGLRVARSEMVDGGGL